MFNRKKSEPASAVEPDAGVPPQKKGRPTPSRRQAESRHNQPLVPADRKEAKRKSKELRDAAYRRQQVALETGDERYLPVRDKGRVRRFTRDWLDARWSLSEFVVPAMLVFLAVMLAASFLRTDTELVARVIFVLTAAFYVLLLASIVEGVVVWQRLRRRIAQRYPDDAIPRGTWFYCYSRMVMARRWRTPKPQVARGEFPAVSH
ncbi:MAG: DUF3043 domain-containing protein [Actinomyces sp.]|nr:DUF3043 domain-containing protein [Actinomyces sp.]MCI1641011.1 DUF3043 domain-containing protein [Actinomyces sp.]MCI1661379.1 DUF3043 domain-containing protein [Actinomyces sp.]MCI1690387.1 DUF3043 domain-containing protein [Actinomyces sp.]MCI1787028.1 DUF3043 domain-containing protein [Actinomyces sp.]MCI1829406.1 DUF3043 domain-containing protein [Actinomyces sp.]